MAEPACIGGYSGMCDCTCPGPAGYEGGGCADCPADCFLFVACIDSEKVSCPSEDDYRVRYLSHEPILCSIATFEDGCKEWEAPFETLCGCGCISDVLD